MDRLRARRRQAHKTQQGNHPRSRKTRTVSRVARRRRGIEGVVAAGSADDSYRTWAGFSRLSPLQRRARQPLGPPWPRRGSGAQKATLGAALKTRLWTRGRERRAVVSAYI